MSIKNLQPGDVVYAAVTLHNDGGIPDMDESAVLAQPGSRGVIINAGHLEHDPSAELYLVRFEGKDLTLGPPVGCLPEELTAQPEGSNR